MVKFTTSIMLSLTRVHSFLLLDILAITADLLYDDEFGWPDHIGRDNSLDIFASVCFGSVRAIGFFILVSHWSALSETNARIFLYGLLYIVNLPDEPIQFGLLDLFDALCRRLHGPRLQNLGLLARLRIV